MQTLSESSEARRSSRDYCPVIFDQLNAVSPDFLEFLLPSHKKFTTRQQNLVEKRERALTEAHFGRLPNHFPASEATTARWSIRYRNGVLHEKGASLLDGYMEDVATDRIHRLMNARRTIHRGKVKLDDGGGNPVALTPEPVTWLFDEQFERILDDPPSGSEQSEIEKYRQARQTSEEMIVCPRFNPA